MICEWIIFSMILHHCCATLPKMFPNKHQKMMWNNLSYNIKMHAVEVKLYRHHCDRISGLDKNLKCAMSCLEVTSLFYCDGIRRKYIYIYIYIL